MTLEAAEFGGWHDHLRVSAEILEFDPTGRGRFSGPRAPLAIRQAFQAGGGGKKIFKPPNPRPRRRRGFVIILLRSKFANDLNH